MTDQETLKHEIVLRADLIEVRKVSPWLEEIAARFDFTTGFRSEIELCIAEICNNIIVHGYGEDGSGGLHLSALVESDLLTIEVVDEAPPFDISLAAVPEPDSPTIHGYGLMIVRKVTEEFYVSHGNGSNLWVMKFAPKTQGNS